MRRWLFGDDVVGDAGQGHGLTVGREPLEAKITIVGERDGGDALEAAVHIGLVDAAADQEGRRGGAGRADRHESERQRNSAANGCGRARAAAGESMPPSRSDRQTVGASDRVSIGDLTHQAPAPPRPAHGSSGPAPTLSTRQPARGRAGRSPSGGRRSRTARAAAADRGSAGRMPNLAPRTAPGEQRRARRGAEIELFVEVERNAAPDHERRRTPIDHRDLPHTTAISAGGKLTAITMAAKPPSRSAGDPDDHRHQRHRAALPRGARKSEHRECDDAERQRIERRDRAARAARRGTGPANSSTPHRRRAGTAAPRCISRAGRSGPRGAGASRVRSKAYWSNTTMVGSRSLGRRRSTLPSRITRNVPSVALHDLAVFRHDGGALLGDCANRR